ncbi:MAG TPA: hypothetical protein PLE64_14535, partial [Spirochaetota bacterium]|nr:hypothetical protein [Spirochaetota bacterium]
HKTKLTVIIIFDFILYPLHLFILIIALYSNYYLQLSYLKLYNDCFYYLTHKDKLFISITML